MIQKLFFLLIIKPFMAIFIGLRIYGRENLPRKYPFIVVANHSSHLDTISLLSIFRLGDLHRVRPIAAADYFEKNKLVSFFTHTLFNILPIVRTKITKENNPVTVMRKALQEGQSLIIFPEGTRSVTGEIGGFRSGIAHLISEFPDIKVIPIYLSNMWRSLPKGEFLPIPFFCEIAIGQPIQVSCEKSDIVQKLEYAVRELKDKSEEWQ